ncbi:restriction endonuclease subunit S [uncultured Clostridium sp.]|uniref:restriction endonuclease subunit S n=1 Tax=uncultured Clostridium sp. TaxID=59620 RepID=UPI0025CDDFD8|nr:restriction endonuclease subunit S [uncultured Clostridium sp.]MDU4882587.1 restriction endonuclease subunit S [Clostridium celatum]MDU7076720.1 restriction endonuclease subunit S [Clostridium celatum]
MKKIRDGYKMTELGEIPSEWDVRTINDLIKENIIIDVMDGNHGEIHPKASDYVDIGIPFIMANNLKNGKLDIENCKFISYEQAKSLRKGFAREGDVLLTHKGTLGETAIVPKLNDEYIMLTPQVTYYRVSDNNILINRYLKVYFDSKKYQDKLKSFGSQSTRDYVGITEQRKLSIVLPTIEEQEKIALILSTVDGQIDNVDALIEKNKELKKGLMQTLLTKGIGHTKFKKTEIGEIPDEWEVKSLDDFNISNSYGPRFSSDLYDECGNCKVIRGTDVIRNGKVQYKGIPYANIDNQILETHKLIKNDFVVVTTADCGMSFVFNDNGTYMPSAYMVRIRFNDNINPYFVNKFFETKVIRRQVEQHIRKGTIANLPGSDLLKFKIYVPSLLEQEKIVSILSEVDKKIEEYENKKQKLEELKKGLMQQLLTGKIRVN